MIGATLLTAFNDNAAVTYLATFAPGFSEKLKFSVVAGAVTGSGLTVIANAPNPAGQSILQSSFGETGVSPSKLFLAALAPTFIVGAALMLLPAPSLSPGSALAAGLGHFHGVERGGQFRLGEDLLLDANLADGLAGLRAFLGDLGGAVVADDRRETRDHRHAVLDQFVAARFVRGDAFDAFFPEDVRGVCQEADALQDVVREDGHHDVQVEVAVGARPGDGGVVADDLRADLHEGFAHDRVDLAGHDGTARLRFRQPDLADAAARAAAEPADVVGDLEEAHGDGLEQSAGLYQAVLGPLRLEVVGRLAEGDFRAAPEVVHDLAGEVRMAVEAGADRGAAKREFLDGGDGVCRARPGKFNLPRVAAEFLPQANGGGVHEVRAAYLDHVPEFCRFAVEGAFQFIQRRDELALDRFAHRDVDGAGDDVVARLPVVDVVVRMDGILRADGRAGKLRTPVRDDLVRVHVGAGAGAGLEDIDGEMRVERPVDDFLRGARDEGRPLFVQLAKLEVGLRGGPFQQAERADEDAAETVAAYREVKNRALRARPVERLGGDLHRPHRIFFQPAGHAQKRSWPLADSTGSLWPLPLPLPLPWFPFRPCL